MKKRKLRVRYTCSDFVHHEHRWYWSAYLCGIFQLLKSKIRKPKISLRSSIEDKKITECNFVVKYDHRIDKDFFQRRGLIKIKTETLLDSPNEITAVLKNFLPTNVTFELRRDYFIYEGLHPGFDAIDPDEATPNYGVELTTIDRTPTEVTKRVKLVRT